MSIEVTAPEFDNKTLDLLMPMHLIIDQTGQVTNVGPTLAKLQSEFAIVGAQFFDVFELIRPVPEANEFNELRSMIGAKMRLVLNAAPQTTLKGMLVELRNNNALLLNISFGISIVEAVDRFALTIGDFAPTDLAVEMLYLFEAKSVVMEETRALNQRLHQAQLVAEDQASTDVLTGLKNRRAMDGVLANKLVLARKFGLMHLDLDFFKQVNDTFGHAAGDKVLQKAANILLQETRAEDIVARVGGDEFVLIFNDIVDRAELIKIAERIVSRLEEPMIFGEKKCLISGSIGITTSNFYTKPEASGMHADADIALYASKHKGRACVTFATTEVLQAAQSSK